jgi:hypothetical protein
VVLATGDLVLLPNQTAPAENGIYVVGVTPARSSLFDTYNEHPGSVIPVQEGTLNKDTVWLCTSDRGGTLGTTALVFKNIVAYESGFAANKNGVDQTGIPTATNTKITFTTEEYDLRTDYQAANSKWVPRAGRYLLGVSLYWTAGIVDTQLIYPILYKNGAAFYQHLLRASGTSAQSVSVVWLIEANGTDEFEIYGFAGGAGDKTISGAIILTRFWGTQIQ